MPTQTVMGAGCHSSQGHALSTTCVDPLAHCTSLFYMVGEVVLCEAERKARQLALLRHFPLSVVLLVWHLPLSSLTLPSCMEQYKIAWSMQTGFPVSVRLR